MWTSAGAGLTLLLGAVGRFWLVLCGGCRFGVVCLAVARRLNQLRHDSGLTARSPGPRHHVVPRLLAGLKVF